MPNCVYVFYFLWHFVCLFVYCWNIQWKTEESYQKSIRLASVDITPCSRFPLIFFFSFILEWLIYCPGSVLQLAAQRTLRWWYLSVSLKIIKRKNIARKLNCDSWLYQRAENNKQIKTHTNLCKCRILSWFFVQFFDSQQPTSYI